MKTLIIYSSKSGTTEKIAKILQKNFAGAKLYNLINNGKNAPDPDNFDLIIAGSGIFFGKIHSSLKKYFNKNIGHLIDKKFAIFVTCKKSKDKTRKRYLDKNFKGMLQDYAITCVCLDKSETHQQNNKTKHKYSTPAERKQLPNINFKELNEFIDLIKSITIETEQDKRKINPVPSIKDIVTAKQKDEAEKLKKKESKANSLQKKTNPKKATTKTNNLSNSKTTKKPKTSTTKTNTKSSK